MSPGDTSEPEEATPEKEGPGEYHPAAGLGGVAGGEGAMAVAP